MEIVAQRLVPRERECGVALGGRRIYVLLSHGRAFLAVGGQIVVEVEIPHAAEVPLETQRDVAPFLLETLAQHHHKASAAVLLEAGILLAYDVQGLDRSGRRVAVVGILHRVRPGGGGVPSQAGLYQQSEVFAGTPFHLKVRGDAVAVAFAVGRRLIEVGACGVYALGAGAALLHPVVAVILHVGAKLQSAALGTVVERKIAVSGVSGAPRAQLVG